MAKKVLTCSGVDENNGVHNVAGTFKLYKPGRWPVTLEWVTIVTAEDATTSVHRRS